MHSTSYRSASSPRGHMARGFTMTELMVMVAIIVAVLAVTVPSFTVIRRDLELSKARSDVSAALAAARTRALRDRTMVALHIFRDGSGYSASRNSADPLQAAYNQSNSLRWGVTVDSVANTRYGIPHVPTNKMTMRLEIAYRGETTNNGIEFICLGDHEPVILPDSLGVANPDTQVGATVDLTNEIGAGATVSYFEDFYIVFGDDGKLMTTLVDYNLNPADNTVPAAGSFTSSGVEEVVSNNAPGTNRTLSASGLCLYDTTIYKAQPSTAAAYNYVNRPDNTVTLSPYTGLPMAEATR